MKKFLGMLLCVAMLATLLPMTMGYAAFLGEPVVLELQMTDSTPDTGLMPGDTIHLKVVCKSGFGYFSTGQMFLNYSPEYFSNVARSVKANNKFGPVCGFMDDGTGVSVVFGGARTDYLDPGEVLFEAKVKVKDGLPDNVKTKFDLDIVSYGCVMEGEVLDLPDDFPGYDLLSDKFVEGAVAPIPASGNDLEVTVNPVEVKEYDLTVAAVNGTITATYGDKENEDWDAIKTEKFATGTEIELTAVADSDDATFLYWRDAGSGRIVHFGKTYAFTTGTAKTLQAIFVEAEGGYAVEFTDRNNKVYTSTLSTSEITVPSDPYMLGYTFGGWAIGGSVTGYKAGDVIPAGTFTENTKLAAVQTLDDTTYTVTLTGAKEAGGAYKYNTLVKVTADVPDGKTFSYWKRDGKIVSYNSEYSFYVGNYATTVEAVFADEAVAAVPTIVMAAPTVVAGNKISFMMERDVPAGYKVIETGILLKEGTLTDGDITLNNYTHKATSSNVASYGAYTVRKANVAVGDSWSGVGYLLCSKDGNVYTIYSNVVSYTMN